MHVAKLVALELVWAGAVVSALVHAKLGVEDHLRPRETQATLGHANPHVGLHGIRRAHTAIARVREQSDKWKVCLPQGTDGTGDLGHLHERQRALVHPRATTGASNDNWQVVGTCVLKAPGQLLPFCAAKGSSEEREVVLHPHDLHGRGSLWRASRWRQRLHCALDRGQILGARRLLLQLGLIVRASEAELQEVLGAHFLPEGLVLGALRELCPRFACGGCGWSCRARRGRKGVRHRCLGTLNPLTVGTQRAGP
mmetsp:Transcript_67070/g.178641  ORF Transcript_67070/g.178641 Transcript_67070/m.178641 type:complete len:254 (+) Transcript_67070:3402-4163(+)